MQSGILTSIGLGGLDIIWLIVPLLLFIIVLFILLILQNKKIKTLQEKYDTFMEGKDGHSLEEEFTRVFKEFRSLKALERDNRDDIEKLIGKMNTCYRKTGLVKYNAFREMGGMLSFSLCMLDEKDDGFILNSVHSNTGCYTYTKEIVNGQSFIELGEEEKEALNQAISERGPKEKKEAPELSQTPQAPEDNGK
ncbi:MAG: DUF4446 family protein [Lachnospiraceae bacterium]|nr:DUF4446 family protein [Lachnospiraceae bacterium]